MHFPEKVTLQPLQQGRSPTTAMGNLRGLAQLMLLLLQVVGKAMILLESKSFDPLRENTLILSLFISVRTDSITK